jgi:blue copper oxidase
MINRRNTLKSLAFGAAALSGALPLTWRTQAQSTDAFPNPLKIPALSKGTVIDGVRHFDLSLQEGSSQFLAGLSTPTWGINGDYLGPTLQMQMGERVRLNVTNNLNENSNLHWHGFLVPALSDGGAALVVQPGETWRPEFEVVQRAATNWYHSHIMEHTGEQVYKGLAGMMIIEDEESANLGIPADYGVDDIPVIVQDRNFNQDGSLRYVSEYGDMVKGIQGDTILVNGTTTPHFVARTQKLRLRILNAANARTFMFGFDDEREFQQIASDGGLLESPLPRTRMILAPAERAEIIVDLSNGAPATLVSHGIPNTYPDYPGAMSQFLREIDTQGFAILALRPQSQLDASAAIAPQLAVLQRYNPQDAVRTRRLELMMGAGSRSGRDSGPHTGRRSGFGGGFGGGDYSINGRRMTTNYINERVPLGDLEIWELYNRAPMTHPIHIHNAQFQILDRDGAAPPPEERGLKDTVRVKSGETVRLMVRFEHYRDAEHAYMYHCHMLEHEDRGMMGQFLVV